MGLSTGEEIVLSQKVYYEANTRSGWKPVEKKAVLKGIGGLYDAAYLFPIKQK